MQQKQPGVKQIPGPEGFLSFYATHSVLLKFVDFQNTGSQQVPCFQSRRLVSRV